jgi:hypothetical protein
MAIDKPAIAALLREYRKAYSQSEGARECAKIAFRLASAHGHLPLRQGELVECARCGKSGTAREVLAGPVHLEPCGAL